MATDKTVPHSFTRSGIYYFERRVPRNFLGHYSLPEIAYSLRTRSASLAASRATRAAQQLDEYWYHIRISDRDLPGKHLLKRERIRRQTYKARERARQDVFDYFEMFYDPKRKHARNGMPSPVDFENRQCNVN